MLQNSTNAVQAARKRGYVGACVTLLVGLTSTDINIHFDRIMSARSSEVALIVSRAITARRLVAGAKLGERELGDAVGVSRIVARQALIRLAEDGLVVVERNRGAFVATPSLQETLELFDALTVLEQGVAVGLMDRVDDKMWLEIKHRTALDAESGTQNLNEEPNMAADFHTLFVGLSKNRVLVDMHAQLMRRALALNSVYQWGRDGCSLLKDHEKLLELIEKRQLRPALDNITRHYQHIVRAYDFESPAPTHERSLVEALGPYLNRSTSLRDRPLST